MHSTVFTPAVFPPTTTQPMTNEAKRAWWGPALARYTKTRREELGMTVAQAAELAGLAPFEWSGIEEGWIPNNWRTIRAIADALRVRWAEYDFLALVAGFHQERR